MSVRSALRRLLGGSGEGSIRVHVMLKGRTGTGWYDVDERVSLPAGATLESLFEAVERRGVDLRQVIASSPHLGHTLMVNGERCPVDENLGRRLSDGDEIFLLAPLAGG